MRPMLRPGSHVLERGDGLLQVGLHPDDAVLLDPTDEVRRALGLIAGAASTAEHEAAGTTMTLERLDRLGVLVEHGQLRRDEAVRARRSACTVETRTFGHPAGAGLADDLARALATAGVTRCGPPARGRHPDVAVLLGVGEPDRELVDGWTRAGTPYLLVRLTERRAVVGPFVATERTACLRCIDAHLTDADASWPLLVRQYAAASARDRPDGTTEPVDPLLAGLAAAWAAHDLVAYLDGHRPGTWSTTVTLQERFGGVATVPWLRHPECGCSWG